MSGWIKLHRKLTETSLWTSEPFTRGQAWVDLILLANHEYGFFFLRDHKIEVQRGQVGYSQLKLAERWKWSRTKVKNFLNTLEKEQQVIQQQSHSTGLVTIVNYEEYQKKEQQGIQQEDNRKTTGRQQEDTNKKNKEEKEEKEEKDIVDLKTNPETVDCEKFRDFFNEQAKGKVPTIRILDEPRKRVIRRMVARYTKKTVIEVIEKAVKTDFFLTWPGFGFDWLMREKNFIKVLEGTYDNKKLSFSKNGQTETIYTPPKIKTDWK